MVKPHEFAMYCPKCKEYYPAHESFFVKADGMIEMIQTLRKFCPVCESGLERVTKPQ